MASLLSVNGELKGMYYIPNEEEARSIGYEPVKIGYPLVVRYLRFFLNHPKSKNKTNEELMISTFVKTAEEKQGAAEAVNYYNPETEFKNGIAKLADFGGKCYGHELCYYTKSYLGESIRLTTKIMELDNPDQKIEAISDGIQKIGSMPIFVEYLPYVASAKAATDIIGRIWKMLDRDDPIVKGLDLDLFFKRTHSRKLQSGRIVCIKDKNDEEIINRFRLDEKNRLIQKENGKEYTETSYYVIQINSEHNQLYEGFEHFQKAAELLAKTNRGGNMQELVQTLVDSVQDYNDINNIQRIENLRYDTDVPGINQKIKALFKSLSPQLKELYKPTYDKIISG